MRGGEGDIIQLSHIRAIDEDAIYVICSRWHFEEYLNVLGIGANIIFYPEYLLFLKNKVDSSLFSDKYNYSSHMVNETIANVVKNAKKYLELLEMLEDENSKKLLASIVLFRTNFDLNLTRDVKTTKLHYWDVDLYEFSEDDVIVDGGGYTGDSLMTFINGGLRCKEYWLFEPTQAIASATQIVDEADFTVHLCRKGLSDLSREIRFSLRLGNNGELEGVSAVDEDGESTIEVVRLDEYMNKKPTFVKLDVEGSELAALNGGEKCFDEGTSFAICAYHKVNDIIDIFQWLKKNGRYRFYMRAERNNLMVDFVIYAISTENYSK